MSAKQTAIACVNYAMGHAVDDLYRATRTFGKCLEEQLDKPYGSSSDTPRQILTEYQNKVTELQLALNWLEKV